MLLNRHVVRSGILAGGNGRRFSSRIESGAIHGTGAAGSFLCIRGLNQQRNCGRNRGIREFGESNAATAFLQNRSAYPKPTGSCRIGTIQKSAVAGLSGYLLEDAGLKAVRRYKTLFELSCLSLFDCSLIVSRSKRPAGTVMPRTGVTSTMAISRQLSRHVQSIFGHSVRSCFVR